MKFLVKKLNKYNGNICCGLENEAGQYYVTECDRLNGTVNYSLSSDQVIDICLLSPSDYLITYGTQDIYSYNSGTLALYTNIGQQIDLIENGEENEFFGFDKSTRKLFKFSFPFSLVWEITLYSSGSQEDARIQYREADGTILYNDSEQLTLIRDDVTYGTVIGSQYISGYSPMQGVSYSVSIPSVINMEYRTVTGTTLDQSSSSSSESSTT